MNSILIILAILFPVICNSVDCKSREGRLCHGVTKEDLIEAFKKYEVIPDIIDTPPNEFLIIKYGSIKVKLGNELKPIQAQNQPIVKWTADPNKYYVLIMIDADPPSRQNPIFREWQHWLVGNILGDEIDNGDVLTNYRGPGPPKNTGLHRYIFLVYKQSKKLSFDEPKLTNTNGRGKFSVRRFVEKYNLGQPIAGNFFQAQSG